MGDNAALGTPIGITALKGLALFTSLVSGGGMATMSLMGIPALVSALPDTNKPGVGGSPCAGIAEKLEQRTRTKTALSQFGAIYAIGRAMQPPSTLATAMVYGSVAWWIYLHPRATPASGDISHVIGHAWTKYAFASGLVFSVLPFTFGLMEPTSHSLLRIAGLEPEMTEDEKELNKDFERETSEVRKLLTEWSNFNAVRSGLMFAAGGLGIWAAFTGE